MVVVTSRAAYELGRRGDSSLLFAGRPIVRAATRGALTLLILEDGELVSCRAGYGPDTYRSGVRVPVASLLVLTDDPLSFLVGTEPGSLYRCDIDGDELLLSRVCSFEELDCREGWYSPWGESATIRSLTQTADGWMYAGIQSGSIMRSRNQGKTWEAVAPIPNAEIEQVAACPAAPERLYVNTATGPYLSYDHGTTWVHRAQGWSNHYGWAVAAHPAQPDSLLISLSDGEDGGGHVQLLRSDDAGETWEHVTAGFPASTPHIITGHHLAFGREGFAWAALGQDLFLSRDCGLSWERIKSFEEPILAICG